MTKEWALNGEIVHAQRKGKIRQRTLYCLLPQGLDESDALQRKHKVRVDHST